MRPHREGQIIGLYLALYGAVRFGVEFLRAHDASNPFGGPFVLEQWISLVAIAAGIYLMLRQAPVVTLKPAPTLPAAQGA
jgi:prolipoprotein diacylglyceryltransferase